MKKFLTTPQAAEILGLRPQTLAIWRCNRKGPPFLKIGGSIRYVEAELFEWADSNRVEAAAG